MTSSQSVDPLMPEAQTSFGMVNMSLRFTLLFSILALRVLALSGHLFGRSKCLSILLCPLNTFSTTQNV